MIKKKYKRTFASLILSLFFFGTPSIAFAQSQSGNLNAPQQSSQSIVKGTIKDATGEPLIGVSVVIKGTTNGTMTDTDGQFSISCKKNDVLLVSYVGFLPQEIAVGNKTNIQITLVEDSKMLDEVIVIGYGTTTRKSAVGAVDQVKSDIIEDRPVANLTQALQGAAPNLIIQQKSFNPNDNKTNLNIRGVSTFSNNSPLIVIDGLIADEGSFNKINPADVENISILKDAGTAAIYGSRSANGVILITTKKGKKNERPVVRLSGMMGWQNPDILFSPVKGYQNATLRNLALTNVGSDPTFTPAQIRDLAAHQDQESWFYDQIMRTALQQNYNLSVSGGGENNTYMISLGYYDQESNYVGNKNFGIERYNMRTNLTAEYGRFKISGILAYTRNNSISTTGGSLEIDASRVPQYYYYKMKADNGHYLLNDVLNEFNPLGALEAGGTNKYRNNYLNANVNVEFKILDGLKLRGVLGTDVIGDHRFTRQLSVPYYSSATATTPQTIGNANRETGDYNHDAYLINSQILADYNKSFGNHNLTALFGATNESFTATSNEIKMKFTDPDLGTSAGDETEIPVGGGSQTSVEKTDRWSISSLLGRLGYNYAEKYYAEFSFRYDGSSKFAKGHRWGFFPSVSMGWRLSEEGFMTNYRDNIGDLKIRGSYGILGNQSIGTYDRFTRYTMHNNSYAYNNSAVTGAGFTLGKEDLTWEKTKTVNVGVDASFLNNSLNLTFDYFHKKTTDILMKPIVPSVFGTELPMDNIGEMKNQGWDMSLSYRLRTGQFDHNFGVSLGDAWNEVTKYEGFEQISGMEELSRIIRVGVPINSYYGYKTDGFFQSYEEIEASAIPVGNTVQPGDLKFVDRNNDGVIDSKDRYILGNAFPRYTYGFTYNLTVKGFDFSMLWQGVGKRDMMIRGELVEPFHSNYSFNIYKHQLDFWTPTNTDATWPRLTAPGSASSKNNYRDGSDLYIFDGKYLRLKNIQLGYTLPKVWSTKAGMQKVRLYVNAQNLFTFSKNSFIDPESSEFGTNMNTDGANSGRNYPTLKYYGFGIDIEF